MIASLEAAMDQASPSMRAASRFETLAQEFDQMTISTFGRPYMGLNTRDLLEHRS